MAASYLVKFSKHCFNFTSSDWTMSGSFGSTMTKILRSNFLEEVILEFLKSTMERVISATWSRRLRIGNVLSKISVVWYREGGGEEEEEPASVFGTREEDDEESVADASSKTLFSDSLSKFAKDRICSTYSFKRSELLWIMLRQSLVSSFVVLLSCRS